MPEANPGRRPDLSEAHLARENLCWADLTRADLAGALLTRVDLQEATLFGVNLKGADLGDAPLTGANLHRARIGWTVLGNLDLDIGQGLETVQHEGPSTIGIDTLYRSHGNIPEVFLRGVGVPDGIINVKSLVGRPFEFYSCFISYSHADRS